MYFGPPNYGYALNSHFCLFDHTRDTSIIYEIVKFSGFIYNHKK